MSDVVADEDDESHHSPELRHSVSDLTTLLAFDCGRFFGIGDGDRICERFSELLVAPVFTEDSWITAAADPRGFTDMALLGLRSGIGVGFGLAWATVLAKPSGFG